ncbi:MAG: FliI/YscN family ATPase [Saccharospirillaceae bacterium]|nr:FliI/YscN family ATPase [Pseudomonadales bacterium]NRB79736.1 FliI/YscN family ATPase [Saccharospirillaceae bacterium]
MFAESLFEPYLQAMKKCETIRKIGRIQQFYGNTILSKGPDVFLGECCEIYCGLESEPVFAEVIGIKDGNVVLMPYDDIEGIRVGSEVIGTGKKLSFEVGDHLLGSMLDGLGRVQTQVKNKVNSQFIEAKSQAITPLERCTKIEALKTKIPIFDCLLPIAEGQRIGIFAGSGVGKSTLMLELINNMQTDINVVALVGERGREVSEFYEQLLQNENMKNTIVVAATSDAPALQRVYACLTATRIAEYFRDQNKKVGLFVDSMTRYAMALREKNINSGEPPATRGYTASVFTEIPKLFERAGKKKNSGSITGIYSVLVEGDDFEEPVSDTMRATLDGHIVLTRRLANKGLYPAIDILESRSRLASKIFSSSQQNIVNKVLNTLSNVEENRQAIELGIYKPGSNTQLDADIKLEKQIIKLLFQNNKQVDFTQLTNLVGR